MEEKLLLYFKMIYDMMSAWDKGMTDVAGKLYEAIAEGTPVGWKQTK